MGAGETLRLATPWALMGLLLVPLLLLWARRRARPPRLTFSDTRIMAVLNPGWRARLRGVPLVLRVLALILLVGALARPQAENHWQEILSEGVDVVIALDQSGSMAAVDLGRKPGGDFDPISRLDYAQKVIEEFIQGRQADRIGLVVFAGRAFTRCPLTLDYGLLSQILESIEITKRYDGTAIGMGLATSVNRLKDSEARSRVVVLVTDGRNNAGEIDPETAARLAMTMGVKVYTVGVGTEGVAPIPVDDPVFGPRYVYQPVDLDEKTLRRIADLTEGRYFRATDAKALAEIFARIDALETVQVKIKERVRRQELFPYLAFPGLGLLLLQALLGWTVFRAGALMRLAAPALLLLWVVLPLLVLIMGLGMARQRALLTRLGRHRTVRRLAPAASVQRRAAKATLLLVALFFVILALARPQWGRVVEPVTRRGVDVVLALDVSQSMHAEDVTPNRFSRARALAGELLTRLEGNRVGLVAFAGSGFIQCPLTLDHSAVRLFLDILDVGDVPDPGSNLEEAIRIALTAFPEESSGRRVLVLLTDGEDFDGSAATAAAAAAEAGVVVYAIGLGTAAGGPIPRAATSARSAGYKKDSAGRIITTRLDPEHLDQVARAGGGSYLQAGAALVEADHLAGEIDRMEKSDLSSRMVTTHKDRFQLPLLVAVCFLFVEMVISPARRSWEDR